MMRKDNPGIGGVFIGLAVVVVTILVIQSVAVVAAYWLAKVLL
jgi:hypothetical protein